MNKFNNISLILGVVILLSSCGGGGAKGGDNDVSSSNPFDKLEKVLPFFMDKTKHDLLMLRLNMSVVSLHGIVIGAEDAAVDCKSGFRDKPVTTVVVNDTQSTLLTSVKYVDCVSENGGYQDGEVKIKSVSNLANGDDAVIDTFVTVTRFINTNYPRILNSEKNTPLGAKLLSVKVAVTGSRHDVISSSRHASTASKVTFKTDKGDELVVDDYDRELVKTRDGSILKKHTVSAEWDMSNDASHNKMIRTASFLVWIDGLTRTFSPGHYKMNVKILEDLVMRQDDPGFPVSGSYQVTLERGQKSTITLLTEFNASGAVVTRSENGSDSVSKISR